MARGRPLPPLALADGQREQLASISNSTSMPRGLVQRARIVLASAEGLSNKAVAGRVGVSEAAVGKWRRRLLEGGVEGLHDELRSGRPRTYSDERVAGLINRALREKPRNANAWSVRRMAAAEGVSKSTVQRWFTLFGVKPHRSKTFKLSSDPFFVEKVRGAAGLCLNPPDNAMVLCVDGKSQIQAPDRTQPTLPLGLGHVEGCTHDCARHGTTTLFAALDAATGKAVGKCAKRHRHQEFLAFLRRTDRETPPDLDLHLVLDTCATHKHPKVRAWLARRPRFSTSTARRPPPHGSTRWSAGSPPSASAPSSGDRSTASPISSGPSKASSPTATRPRPRSPGSRRPIQSSGSSKDCPSVFAGRNTSDVFNEYRCLTAMLLR